MDRSYPYYFPNSELYGDINFEFRTAGSGGQGFTSTTENDLIHYYRLGFRSYIFDPRLIQYNVEGRFYQDLKFGDNITNDDYYRFGGLASVSLFPRSFLKTVLTYGREEAFNPRLTTTNYQADILFFRSNWPVVNVHLNRYDLFSDDKQFPQDTIYTRAHLDFAHVIYFKPARVRLNGNGNGNGNGEGGTNGEKKGTNGTTRLVILGFYEYYKIDDNLSNMSTQEHRAQLALQYYFNNNLSFIYNYYDWTRFNNDDQFRVSLRYFHQATTQLSYNLEGYFTYSLPEKGSSGFGGGLAGSLTKIFSPQWRADVGVGGNFATGGVNGENQFGVSGFGQIASRIFKDFDWGGGVSGAITTGEGDTAGTYNVNLNGLYRLALNKTLTAAYNLYYTSGTSTTHTLDNRLQLFFDGNWAPRFTYRSIVEFRLQNLNGDGGGGNNMIVSWDNYGIYRFTPQTTLSLGVYFAHESPAQGESNQRFRVYATLSSNPWRNLSYSINTELNYEIQKARWTVRIYPQVYYVWRKLYFSLQGEFNYFNESGNNSWNYNYYLTFKVTRPFSIIF